VNVWNLIKLSALQAALISFSLGGQSVSMSGSAGTGQTDFLNDQWIRRPGIVLLAMNTQDETRVASAVDPGRVIIAPRPAGGIIPRPTSGPSLEPYFTPVEVGAKEARLIWEQKQIEADTKGFQWGKAVLQSGMLLAIAEAYRLGKQPETRAQLKGPYLKDWWNAVKGLRQWDDTDSWLANYVGHPMQGAVTGYIQIQNDPRGRLQEFGKSKYYWKSRGKAVLWATAYSTFYELSPLGDAGIGNVGHITKDPGRKGYVDLVITPTLGLALLLVEDIIDMKVVWPIEKRTNNVMTKRLLRSFLGMHRSFTNLLRFKLPWYIDSRGPVDQPAIRYSQMPGPY
jgi:hypothetical protein